MTIAYILERLNWRQVGADAWLRLPGEWVVGTFATLDEAAIEARNREIMVRHSVGHPFRCGSSVYELSTFPLFAFLDWLQDAGIEPPDQDPDGCLPWRAWADLYTPTFTRSQLDHLWEGANRVRFFRVRERTCKPLVAVLRINWKQSDVDERYVPEEEGGTLSLLWHDCTAAARDCEQKQRFAVEELTAALAGYASDSPFDHSVRDQSQSDPWATADLSEPIGTIQQSKHCELWEVAKHSSEILRRGSAAYVVLRRGWGSWDTGVLVDQENDHMYVHNDEYGGVPVQVFATEAEAKVAASIHEQDYRAFANPFRFDSPQPRVRMPNYTTEQAQIRLAFTQLGLPEPELDPNVPNDWYRNWKVPLAVVWNRLVDRLTEDQRSAIWSWFRNLTFFEVCRVRVADEENQPATPSRSVRTIYYVRATNWVPDGGPRVNPHRFLGAYTVRTRAEKVRDEAERATKANPPANLYPPMPISEDVVPWSEVSSWSPAEVGEYFYTHGLIGERERGWFRPTPYWWESHHKRFRPDQVRAIWHVLDRVRLYEVRAIQTECAE